jgi:hypothetical protein
VLQVSFTNESSHLGCESFIIKNTGYAHLYISSAASRIILIDMATSKSSTPASAPTLSDHLMKHAVVPILGDLALYTATGIAPGASSATLAATNTASPRLGLSKDKKFTFDGWWHFSALITHISDENGHGINLDDPEDFSDARLTGIAAEGHRDMISLLNASNALYNERPKAMTALIAGGELYLSSSIKKNGPGFRQLFPNSPVADALERCSQVTAPLAANPTGKLIGDMHHTGGNCGEPGALQLYYLRHGWQPWQGKPGVSRYTLPDRSRIVTWDGRDIMPPCEKTPENPMLQQRVVNGRPETPPADLEWGCERLTTELNVRAINKGACTPVPAQYKLERGFISLAAENGVLPER